MALVGPNFKSLSIDCCNIWRTKALENLKLGCYPFLKDNLDCAMREALRRVVAGWTGASRQNYRKRG